MEYLDKHEKTSWQISNIHDFWNDIAANRRSLQIYENERSFLLTLEGFAGSGLLANERVVIIAMRDHLDQLHFRLQQQFAKLPSFISTRQYVPMDVADIRELIMVEGNFAGDLLYELMHELFSDTTQFNRTRLYSEISATLLAQQLTDSMLQLDHCWSKLHMQFAFTHFRAFPRELILNNITTPDFYNSNAILIQGDLGSSTEVTYQQFHPNIL